MPYTYAGQAIDHTLVALKGWYREAALDAEVIPSSNVNIGSVGSPLTSGLCVHVTDFLPSVEPYGGVMDGPATFEVEMGCGDGHGMPLWTWPGSTDPDISNPGVEAGAPIYGSGNTPPAWISVLPPAAGGKMPALVATGAYEFEITEFDTDQTYTAGNGLRAVTSNTDADAGKLTNQRATTAAFNSNGATQFGDPTLPDWDTIVGVVSRGAYTNANRIAAMAFWPVWIPGTR